MSDYNTMPKTKYPILITECPECGKMSAARSPYLEPKLDADGKPDPNIGTLVTIECDRCALSRPIPASAPWRPSIFDLFVGGVCATPNSVAVGRLQGC